MKKITINCEKLNHPNTGLYQYCANLSTALLAEQPAGFTMQIYAPLNKASIYPNGTAIVASHAWHKLFNPANYNCHLWHATNQEKDYFPTRRSVKKVITVHDLNYFNDPSKALYKKKRFISNLQRMIERSDQLVCISEYTLMEIKKHIDICIPATVIYNGCNINLNMPRLKPAAAITAPFLFTIGTITDKKNFHVLPALLVGNHYNLVIAGEVHRPAYQQKIKEAAKRLGVAGRLLFTGAITEGEKHWYYENCVAFAFPSLHEGFGLPVVEAMAFGKPIFLSKETSLPEIGGTDAFYFNDFEPGNMRQLMEDKLDYFDKNQTAIESKLKERAQTFSWRQAAIQHWKIYEKVLNGG